MTRTEPPLRNALLVAIALGGSGVLAFWLYGLGFLGIPLVAVQEREVVGGSWDVVQTTSTLGHPSTTRRLLRRRGLIYSTMASYLSEVQYLGDNCVSYEVSDDTGRSVWAACDFNAPIELYRGLGRANFSADGLRVDELEDGKVLIAKSISIREIRRLAGAQ